MFESLFEIDPEAAEADLQAQVEQFERMMKSAAAAAQARATAAWAAKRPPPRRRPACPRP